MSLFNKSKKTEEKTSGNIPEGLGIKQSRADEIIDAVRENYHENDGNINKVFDEIKAEKMTENESIFAYYVVGCIKVEHGRKMVAELGIGDLDGLLEMLEKAVSRK